MICVVYNKTKTLCAVCMYVQYIHVCMLTGSERRNRYNSAFQRFDIFISILLFVKRANKPASKQTNCINMLLSNADSVIWGELSHKIGAVWST